MSSQSSDVSFPSDAELQSNMKNSTKWLKWRDVPLHTWYKIVKKEAVDTQHGNALILTLEDREGDKLTTFTTAIIQSSLKKRPDCNYIRSTGKVENKRYYGFDIVTHN